jgi:hypothetical protein
MTNEQQELLDEAYKNYSKCWEINPMTTIGKLVGELPFAKMVKFTQEEFIDKIKTDGEFADKWGLKIKERKLSRKERSDYYYKNGNNKGIVEGGLDRPTFEENDVAHKWYDDRNVPTKLITITIESYE